MPWKRRHRRKRASHRSGASSDLSSAWKKRNRRAKGGLVTRTAESNRRAIKKLRHNVETKLLENVVAQAPLFAGQIVAIDADNRGESQPGDPAIWRPLRALTEGASQRQRIGNHVTLQRLQYRVEVFPETGAIASEYNRVGMIIVLDTDPTNSNLPNLNNSNATTVTPGTLLQNVAAVPGDQPPYQQYQNVYTCGSTDSRYKVLRHHKGKVQQQAAGATRFPTTVFSGVIDSKYKLMYENTRNTLVNQELLFFMYSDSGTFPAPRFVGYARYWYKDA